MFNGTRCSSGFCSSSNRSRVSKVFQARREALSRIFFQDPKKIVSLTCCPILICARKNSKLCQDTFDYNLTRNLFVYISFLSGPEFVHFQYFYRQVCRSTCPFGLLDPWCSFCDEISVLIPILWSWKVSLFYGNRCRSSNFWKP